MNIMHMYYLTAILGAVTFASGCLLLYLTDKKFDDKKESN